MTNKKVYWLIREEGKSHGFGTVQMDEADSDGDALNVWFEKNPDSAEMFALYNTVVEAVAVSFHYDEEGQPVVIEL